MPQSQIGIKAKQAVSYPYGALICSDIPSHIDLWSRHLRDQDHECVKLSFPSKQCICYCNRGKRVMHNLKSKWYNHLSDIDKTLNTIIHASISNFVSVLNSKSHGRSKNPQLYQLYNLQIQISAYFQVVTGIGGTMLSTYKGFLNT